jgi:acyl carrier protein
VTTDDVEVRVRATIAAHLSRAEELVVPEAKLIDDLKADSLDLVELLQRLEEEFHMTVDEKRAAQLRTVGDVIQYVCELQSAQAAP